MIIKANTKYVTRGGEVVGPLHWDQHCTYPWNEFQEGGCSWTIHGQEFTATESPNDIVSEYREAPQEETQWTSWKLVEDNHGWWDSEKVIEISRGPKGDAVAYREKKEPELETKRVFEFVMGQCYEINYQYDADTGEYIEGSIKMENNQ